MPQWFSTRCSQALAGAAVVAPSTDASFVALFRKEKMCAIVNDQGDVLVDGISTSGEVAKAAWCPSTFTCVTGSSAGHLSLLTVVAKGGQAYPIAGQGGSAPAVTYTAQSQDVKSPHSGGISLLLWSPDGSRLISGDAVGGVAIWRFEANNGKLVQLAVLKRSGVVTHAAFLAYPGAEPMLQPNPGFEPPGQGSASGDSALPPLPPQSGPGSVPCSILFGADNGAVTYLDESSRTVDVLPGLHSPVDVLELVPAGAAAGGPWGPLAARVVIATRALLFVQVGLYGDGRLVNLSRSKVSVRTGGSLRAHAFVSAAGVLASACAEEPQVRCWDVTGPLDEPDHASLSTTVSGRPIPKAERPQCLAYSPNAGLLAIGTDSGHVYLWRNTGGAVSGSGHFQAGSRARVDARAAGWEPVATVGTGSGIESLAWGTSGGSSSGSSSGVASSGSSGSSSSSSASASPILVAKLATGELAILSEAALHRRVAPPIIAVQLSSHEVALERVPPDGSSNYWTMVIRATAPIRGLSATPRNVLVWTATEAQIFTPPDSAAAYQTIKQQSGSGADGGAGASSTPLLRPTSVFRVASPALALAGDSVVSIDAQNKALLVHNFQGVVKATLAVPEGEGTPMRLDSSGNGRFVAVATDKGVLRVYDLGRADPILLGSGVFDAVSAPGEQPVSLGHITSVRVNSDGSRIAILASRPAGTPPVPSARAVAAAEASAKAAAALLSPAKGKTGGGAGFYKAVALASGKAEAVAAAGGAGYSGTAERDSAKGAVGMLARSNSSRDMSSSAASSATAGALLPDTRLYVYSVHSDRTCWWDFGAGMRPVEVSWDVVEPKMLAVQVERQHSAASGKGSGSGSPTAFAVPAGSPNRDGSSGEGDALSEAKQADREIITLCAAPEGAAMALTAANDSTASTEVGPGAPIGVSDSLVLADNLPLEAPADAYLGLCAPHLALLLLPSSVPVGGSRIALSLLRDFVGLETVGGQAIGKGLPSSIAVPQPGKEAGAGASAAGDPADAAKRALLEFSYHAACGNMDGAYSAVRALLSTLPSDGSSHDGQSGPAAQQVWANLAASCVRSKRLDVAAVCLGHMGHARGAKALRTLGAVIAPPSDVGAQASTARAGVLAVQLGLLSDAAKAFQAAGRHDLLCELYADSGSWERALSAARVHDRLHAKRLAHAHGKHLEASGMIEAAVSAYETAGAGPREVPRMLIEAASSGLTDWRALDSYVNDKWREGQNARSAAGVKDPSLEDMGQLQSSGRPNSPRLDTPAVSADGSAKDKATWPDSTSPLPSVSLPSWYGQWLEARGDASARVWYERAGDAAALVRLSVMQGEPQAAVSLVERTGDAAAAYALARALEAQGDIQSALRMYGLSGRVGHAIRLAVSNGMDAEILPLAIRANDARTQAEAAGFLESRAAAPGLTRPQQQASLSKAAQLYARAGSLDKAVNVCLSNGLTDLLPSIVDAALGGAATGAAEGGDAAGTAGAAAAPGAGSGGASSPRKGLGMAKSSAQVALLSKLADHFLATGQHARAVDMLLRAGPSDPRRMEQALELCLTHKVPLTEDMAEAMTPPEVTGEGEAADAARAARAGVLTKLASALKKAGLFHLAAKKYTQAGDKVRALKALLASGDTEKIIFFAQVSRAKDIYVLAANYLQSLPWHTDGDILRTIIDFYSKAKAADSLSAFYEACAAVEIDEYRNYEKAAAALKEALRQAGKIKDEALKEARCASLQGRINIVDRFVAARRAAKTDTDEMVNGCMELLGDADAESAIRVGDVFALLVYFHAQQKAWDKAASLLTQMRSRNIAIDPFIERDLVIDVFTKAGRAQDIPPGMAATSGDGDGVEEDIRPG